MIAKKSHIVSVNVGLPRDVVWQGTTVSTGIFKEPVRGPVMLRALNFDGDRQADLSVHGGQNKAVYAYPAEHYAYWMEELGEMEMPWGMFGENLTTEGLTEKTVHVGDTFRVGDAEVIVTQPRLPCFKLGIRFGRADMERKFLTSGRTGFYCAVLSGGKVEAGDGVELLSRDEQGVSIAVMTRLYAFDNKDLRVLQRAVQIAALPESWKRRFEEEIAKQER